MAELRDRNKEELGRERGVLGVETPRWGVVRHLTGIWKAQGLLICRHSAGRARSHCLPQPRAPAEAPSSRAAKQIIVISLPRLNQCVIKSGSVLPWDFFSGRNQKLKKPQNLIRYIQGGNLRPPAAAAAGRIKAILTPTAFGLLLH